MACIKTEKMAIMCGKLDYVDLFVIVIVIVFDRMLVSSLSDGESGIHTDSAASSYSYRWDEQAPLLRSD